MRHVFVGIPLIGYWVTAGIADFARALGEQNAATSDVQFTLKLLSGSSTISYPVEFMRNRLVSMALADPSVTDLWFIDSDVMPSPNAFSLLRHIEFDIAAGVYQIPDAKRGTVWSAYHAHGPDAFTHIRDLSLTPFEAGGAGTGAMMISRRVLEDPRLRLGPDIDGIPALFRTVRKPTGECETTDDLDFCRRARALDYRILVDPRVRFGHIKTRNYSALDAAPGAHS